MKNPVTKWLRTPSARHAEREADRQVYLDRLSSVVKEGPVRAKAARWAILDLDAHAAELSNEPLERGMGAQLRPIRRGFVERSLTWYLPGCADLCELTRKV